MLEKSQAGEPQGSTQIELNSLLGQLYPLIGERQDSLPEDLDRSRSDETMSDIDDARVDTLCDILSSFDEAVIPSEFRRDCVDHPPPSVPGNGILVPGSLPITMYRLAYRNESFYSRLQHMVPPDERARRYYEKQYIRSRDAIDRLFRYAQSGPLGQRNNREMTVPECAWRVRIIVDQMCTDRDARNASNAIAPLGKAVSSRLAAILVRIVAQVATLNYDIYSNASWNRGQPLNEHPRDRNLFAYLIGDPPNDPSFPPFMRNFFVIDRLREFPTSEWKHLLELLTTNKDAIEEMDGDDMPMAAVYASRIDDMTRDYTATANEPSSSSAQMPRRA